MTGMSTNQNLAILDTKSGIFLKSYDSYKALIEHAIRASWQEFESTEQRIEWMRSLVGIFEEERRSDWVEEYFCEGGTVCEDCRYRHYEPDVNCSECTVEDATDCPALPEEHFPEVSLEKL